MVVEKRKGTRHEVLAMEINLITFLLINNAPWSFARYQFSVSNFFNPSIHISFQTQTVHFWLKMTLLSKKTSHNKEKHS